MYPEDLRYTRDHEWIRMDGGEGTVGITYYAQDALGDNWGDISAQASHGFLRCSQLAQVVCG